MVPSEVEKIFRAFAEKRKAELPRFIPDGIPITLENKFDDAIYNYLYAYWKEQSGEYDPKKDVIPESEMNKMHPKTKNEKKFEQWLLQQYGMTKKEQRGYTLEGNLDSLWEIFSAADMVLLVKALPNIGKNLVQLGKDVLENGIQFDTSLGIVAGGGEIWNLKNTVDDVAEEAIEKTVKKETAEEMAESTAKKEMSDTTEDLPQKFIDENNALENNEIIKEKLEIKYKGQRYNGKRKPENDFVNNKGKSTLEKHASKHGYDSSEDYLSDARNFLEKEPTSATESFMSKEGTYFRYDKDTNEFGIINKYGGISTYFKPDKGITYWLDQIELYAP